MKNLNVAWITVAGLLLFTLAVNAQDTNRLKTDLGVFEAQTGTVIVKGFGQTGSFTAGTTVISVRCKQSADIGAGSKIYGLAVEIADGNQARDLIYLDEGEVDPLLDGLDYLGKVAYGITPLPGFEASYATKAGLRLIAFGSRRQSSIQTFLQYSDNPRILLAPGQLAQFAGLIGQAQKELAAIKTAK